MVQMQNNQIFWWANSKNITESAFVGKEGESPLEGGEEALVATAGGQVVTFAAGQVVAGQGAGR